MQRRGIQKHVDAPHQRQEGANGQTEAVEQRKRVEEPIVVLQVNDREHLAHIGDQIAVAELDAFGHSFRAAGKENHAR